MNSDFTDLMKDLWHDKPGMVVVLAGGTILFLLLVVDTWCHRKKLKGRHRVRHYYKHE